MLFCSSDELFKLHRVKISLATRGLKLLNLRGFVHIKPTPHAFTTECIDLDITFSSHPSFLERTTLGHSPPPDNDAAHSLGNRISECINTAVPILKNMHNR